MTKVTFSGPVKKMDPKRLINKKGIADNVADFFLVLGCFYNDLKSLHFHLIQTNNFFEGITDKELSAKRGEAGGIKTHLEKLTIATINEFFKFINKNKEIMETGEFMLIQKELNSKLKNKWNLIVKISTGSGSEDDSNFSWILLCIRNNLAFHYDQARKVLRRGFINFFYNDKKHIGNERACYSVGKTMNDTRFYYCDAAVQRSILGEVTKKMEANKYFIKLIEIIEDINFTIMALMKEYLHQRPHI